MHKFLVGLFLLISFHAHAFEQPFHKSVFFEDNPKDPVEWADFEKEQVRLLFSSKARPLPKDNKQEMGPIKPAPVDANPMAVELVFRKNSNILVGFRIALASKGNRYEEYLNLLKTQTNQDKDSKTKKGIVRVEEEKEIAGGYHTVIFTQTIEQELEAKRVEALMKGYSSTITLDYNNHEDGAKFFALKLIIGAYNRVYTVVLDKRK